MPDGVRRRSTSSGPHEVDERVRTWREENPKGKRGKHEYRLDDYGLDRETVTEAFADYIERFDIPSESPHLIGGRLATDLRQSVWKLGTTVAPSRVMWSTSRRSRSRR